MTDLSGWPALVLTAGLATRLRPLSDVRAKAAMPVAGKTIIGRILEWLRAAGVRRVLLNLHHRPETITRVVGDGSEWDLEVRYSWERIVMGSAGGPRRAIPLLEADRFLIVNGDTLTNCDLRAIVRHHLDARARVTMAVVPGDVERYGGVLVGPDGRVTGFAKANRSSQAPGPPSTHLQSRSLGASRPQAPGTRVASASSALPALPGPPGLPIPKDVPACFHFIGVQAAEAEAFVTVPDDEPSETIRTLYPRLIAEHPDAIAAYESAAEFFDVGTPADYLNTVATVAAREGHPFDCGVDSEIAPGAVVQGSVLWDRVTVAEGAQLINCVVTDDVEVPQGARHEKVALVAGPSGLVIRAF